MGRLGSISAMNPAGRTIARHGNLPQAAGPLLQSLCRADVLEQFKRRERVELGLPEPPRQFGPRGLLGQRGTLAKPLDVFRRLSSNQPAKEEIHHSGTHRLHGEIHPLRRGIQRCPWLIHGPMVFEQIFEYKVWRPFPEACQTPAPPSNSTVIYENIGT